MRRALVLLLVAALAVTPAFAKTKGEARAIELLNTCEKFTSGDVLAVQWAVEQGWDASEVSSDNAFARTFNGNRQIEGIGDVSLYALIETYPSQTLGYCRIDVSAPESDLGVAKLNDLPTLKGEIKAVDGGTNGSWEGAEKGRDYLLLANQNAETFALQLTTFTPRSAVPPSLPSAPAAPTSTE